MVEQIEESLQIDDGITGLRKAAAVSLKVSMDSFWKASSAEGEEIIFSFLV
jgi:hypothetical protein